jgi:putative protein-disulfide isomerase
VSPGYLEARNPSDRETLIALAQEIGADTEAFAPLLYAPETQAELEREMETGRAMGASSFPSLVLDTNGSRWRVPVDYLNAGAMLNTIGTLS